MKGEFLKCFPYTMSAHVVISHVPVIRYRLEPRAPYISPPTVIILQKNFFAGLSVRPGKA